MKKVIFTLILLFSLPNAYAAEDVNALKAAYLFYFSKFIQWNNQSQNEDFIKICIYKMNSEMEVQANSLRDKKINNKALIIDNLDNLDNLDNCDIAYTGDSIVDIAAEDLRRIILVTDEQSKLADIYFFVNNGRLRFSIDNKKIQAKSMKVSSRLLRLSSS